MSINYVYEISASDVYKKDILDIEKRHHTCMCSGNKLAAQIFLEDI